jgi:hypothetical protein
VGGSNPLATRVYDPETGLYAYHTAQRRVVCAGARENAPVLLAASPGLLPGQWRVVLSWSPDTVDLDLHAAFTSGTAKVLTGYFNQGETLDSVTVNTATANQRATGVGGETVTFAEIKTLAYTFAVHNFVAAPDSQTSPPPPTFTIGEAAAQVDVYIGGNDLAASIFTPPVQTPDQTYVPSPPSSLSRSRSIPLCFSLNHLSWCVCDAQLVVAVLY